MTNSIIAIRGNHFDQIDTIFECFKYIDLVKNKKFDNVIKFNDYLFDNYLEFANRQIVLRGIWYEKGWTIISDPEMTDAFKEEALLKLSTKFNAEVLTFIIQTTSGSFGFAKYYKTKLRSFFSIDGDEMINFNSPLKEENDLNINEKIFVEDILKLSNNFGIDIEGNNIKFFITKQLGYNKEFKNEIKKFKQNKAKQAQKIFLKMFEKEKNRNIIKIVTENQA